MAHRADCTTIHRAMIHDRGGKRRITSLPSVQTIEWGRKRDGVSSARIVIAGESCSEQEERLLLIEPKRHELVIYRGDERVWEGPIVQVGWFTNRVEIVANDVMQYLVETPLSVDWPGPDNGGPPLMGDRIEEIVTHELTVSYVKRVGTGGAAVDVTMQRWEALDPPINVLPHMQVTPGTVQTRSETVAFQMMLGEHIQNLVRSGLDYTVVGRRIIFWDSALSLGRTRTLTENDFMGELQVYAAGTEHTDVVHVVGRAAEPEYEGAPVPPLPVGSAGGTDPYYGAWTRMHSLEDEGEESPTQDALNSQAQRLVRGRTPVPVDLVVPSDATLRLSHDLTITDLVPGVTVPVLARLNLRPMSVEKRIDSMKVVEDAAGETVSVSLEGSEA